MATLKGDKMMKYLMTTTLAITFRLGNFALTQPAQARSFQPDLDNECSNRRVAYTDAQCEARQQMLRDAQEYGEVTDIDPLTETAQGGDRDGDAGGGDFGGENDRAAASTAAE